MSFAVPIWLMVCIVIVAIGCVRYAMIRPEPPQGDYGMPDFGAMLKGMGIIVATIFGVLVTLVVKGFYGW